MISPFPDKSLCLSPLFSPPIRPRDSLKSPRQGRENFLPPPHVFPPLVTDEAFFFLDQFFFHHQAFSPLLQPPLSRPSSLGLDYEGLSPPLPLNFPSPACIGFFFSFLNPSQSCSPLPFGKQASFFRIPLTSLLVTLFLSTFALSNSQITSFLRSSTA